MNIKFKFKQIPFIIFLMTACLFLSSCYDEIKSLEGHYSGIERHSAGSYDPLSGHYESDTSYMLSIKVEIFGKSDDSIRFNYGNGKKEFQRNDDRIYRERPNTNISPVVFDLSREDTLTRTSGFSYDKGSQYMFRSIRFLGIKE